MAQSQQKMGVGATTCAFFWLPLSVDIFVDPSFC